ncbi:MAG: family 10 glycosylhydrolase [Cyanobacteria bacterium J06600_6]
MSELRGVWIANHPHSSVLKSSANILEALDFLSLHGFNTIFPVVWNRGYTLYPSQVMSSYELDEIEPFYAQQQRDPLAEIIQAAHERHIKVIPWLEYGLAASHLANGGQIIQKYPHWQAIDRDGAAVKHGGLTWMNGFLPDVQKFILEIVQEIIENYPVDGIQGCDRLPALPATAGYDQFTQEQYRLVFGEKPPRNHGNRQWIQWRADRLTNFLANMYQTIKSSNSQAIVSLSPAVYPFCLNNLLQDTPAWLAKNLVDILHPQIYRSSFPRYSQEVKLLVKNVDRQLLPKFAPGIAFTANGKDLSQKEIIKCIKMNRKHNLSGQVFFHYEGLRKNNDAMAIALSQDSYKQTAKLPEFLS